MAIDKPVQDFERPNTNRLVWVISNIDSEFKTHKQFPQEEFWYEEKFKDKMVRIPPNRQKRVLMPYITAVRFLGQVRPLNEPLPDGTFVNEDRVEKNRFGKPLEILELSLDEIKQFEGLDYKQAMEMVKNLEKDLSEVSHKTDSAIAIGTGKPQAPEPQRKRVDRSALVKDVQRID